jgi:exodeoxyribonuclease VII large subunit
MWRSRAQLLGWRPENGQRVEARALVSFYEPRGEFQLNVETLRRAGQGDLFERFLKLKAALEEEGLFDAATKRPLPEYPRAVAIVTSLQAAALRDVLTTLRRRAPYLRLDLHPTPVQGDGAAGRIAAAIGTAAAGDCDAIILCRGGGSIEDLWAFNEEIVARAIRASRLPVISGIGHETDFTIADFAADLRAPTPTAAAELLSPDRDALLAALGELQRRLSRLAGRTLADRAQQLDWLGARLIHPAERIRARREALDQLGQRLTRAESIRRATLTLGLDNLGRRLGAVRPRPGIASEPLRNLQSRLDTALRQKFFRSAAKLEQLAGGLSQLDPRAVLRRGYALAVGPDGRAVRDAVRLTPGDGLRLEFARGEAAVTVTQVVATRKGQ